MISSTYDEEDVGKIIWMGYTPQLTLTRSRHLRRIAWAMKKPMTKTLAILIDAFVRHIAKDETRRSSVCNHCKDRSICASCPFEKEPN
jgi:hypothetical protein